MFSHKKVGGIYFLKLWRLRFSFCVARRPQLVPRNPANPTLAQRLAYFQMQARSLRPYKGGNTIMPSYPENH